MGGKETKVSRSESQSTKMSSDNHRDESHNMNMSCEFNRNESHNTKMSRDILARDDVKKLKKNKNQEKEVYKKRCVSRSQSDSAAQNAPRRLSFKHMSGSIAKRASLMGNRNTNKLPPREISDLLNQTHFTEQELKDWHVGFRRDCPEGRLSLQQFSDIYGEFYGTSEAKRFAEHLFRTFDLNQDGTIDFREFMCSLSITTRGTMEEKLRWAFDVYDVDGNGSISTNEVLAIVKSINKMIGNMNEKSSRNDERILEIFSTFDTNHDNKLSLEEFIDGAKSDQTFVQILQCND